MTNIKLPNSITSIGDGAFYNCTSLTAVDIPTSIHVIGISTFEECTGLRSIKIPKSITRIRKAAFQECVNLNKVEIGKSESLVSMVVESSAFDGCTKLTGVYITDLAAWCNIAFQSNEQSNPLYYAKKLYLNNELITDLEIPNTVTKIHFGAFAGCSSLKSVKIPDSVTDISMHSFSNCDGLTSVVIGKSVNKINLYAFKNCKNLINLTTLNTAPPALSYDLNKGYTSFAGVSKNNCTVMVPSGSVSRYKNTDGWSEFRNIVAIE